MAPFLSNPVNYLMCSFHRNSDTSENWYQNGIENRPPDEVLDQSSGSAIYNLQLADFLRKFMAVWSKGGWMLESFCLFLQKEVKYLDR